MSQLLWGTEETLAQIPRQCTIRSLKKDQRSEDEQKHLVNANCLGPTPKAICDEGEPLVPRGRGTQPGCTAHQLGN